MHDARQPAAEREQDVQPEMQAKPDLQEYAERRKKEGEQDADDIQVMSPGLMSARITPSVENGSALFHLSNVLAMISSWISLLPPKMLWERELK